jgi:ribosomal-protein-alanine N-acetyltransferase
VLEVAEGNQAGRRLYGRAGFAVVGRRRGYYGGGEDALVMRAVVVEG